MIVKGGRRGGAQQLASHLLRRDTNEEVIIREMDSHPSGNRDDDDLTAALKLMAAQGQAKGKFRTLYHSVIAPSQGEFLNTAQMKYAADTLAKNLGMEGHQRVIVEHRKDGRQHFHVVFNILHPVTGKQARLQWTKKKEWDTSRQLERELGLKPVAPKGKASQQWEHQRGKRSGIDPVKVRKEVTAIYHASKTGKEFICNLKNAGYVLTKGKNGSYVLVDKAGDIHGLMRRIEGVKLKDLRQKFPDLKGIALPSLDSVLKQRRPAKSTMPKIQAAFRKSAGKNVQYSRQGQTNEQIGGAGSTTKGRSTLSLLPALRHKAVTPTGQALFGSQKSITSRRPKTARYSGLRKRPQSGSMAASNEKSAMGAISKSPLLAAAHATQWKELASRYAARKQAARHEPDQNTREAMLAALEAEEAAERLGLAVKQQAESEADMAAQSQNAAMRAEPPRSPAPKPN